MKDRMTDQPVNAADRKVVYVVVAGLVLACMVIGFLLLLRSNDRESAPAPRGAAVGPTRDRAGRPTAPFRAGFTDVASESGVRSVQESGAAGEHLLPETMGSGVALGDLDSDGDPEFRIQG